MRRMTAGDGYKYLLKSVVYGDGDRALSTPLTRYYAEAGTPAHDAFVLLDRFSEDDISASWAAVGPFEEQ